jgi:hypothetical protein
MFLSLNLRFFRDVIDEQNVRRRKRRQERARGVSRRLSRGIVVGDVKTDVNFPLESSSCGGGKEEKIFSFIPATHTSRVSARRQGDGVAFAEKQSE